MTARYPREQVDAVLRTVHTGTVHRIVLRMGLANPLALRSGKSRFCDGRSYAVLYAAGTLETAFVETVVRDRFVQTDRRVILLDEVRSRGCVEYRLRGTEPLRLVDLREDGCLRLGAPTDS
ncbi:MAG TPA: RES family NAD+ phosphorylase, partial [Nitrospiraceae bacterium]|nr:RES family NAD+ phosphorylase [Nitrospiraceae bacterium]